MGNLAKKITIFEMLRKNDPKISIFSTHSTATPRTPRKKHTIVSTLRGALRGAEFGEKITIFEILRKNDPKISIFSPMSAPCTSRTKKNTAQLRRARRAKSTQLSALCAAQNLAKKSQFLKFCEKMTQKSRFFSPMSAPCTSRTKKNKKKQHGYA